MKQSRERHPFVKARARLSRLPLFLVQGATTPRVKHADESLSFHFLHFPTRLPCSACRLR